MKFILIGASGYIGGCCYRYLQVQGYPVLGTQCASTSPEFITFDLTRDHLRTLLANASTVKPSFFEREKATTAKRDPKEKTFCVLFAAFSQTERCVTEREASYQLNVEGTCRLISEAVELGFIQIYISTSAVYEGVNGYYNEESPRQPRTEYGRQKLLVEKFIGENVPSALILRIDKAVGDRPAKRNPFYEWHTLLQQKKPILCLEQIISPTFVEDIAKAILLSAERSLQGSYNIANTEIFTREELARQFILMMGEETSRPENENQPGEGSATGEHDGGDWRPRRDLIRPVSERELGFRESRPARTFLDPRKFINATGFSFTPMGEVIASFKKNLVGEMVMNKNAENTS